jgi:hypothetical protein
VRVGRCQCCEWRQPADADANFRSVAAPACGRGVTIAVDPGPGGGPRATTASRLDRPEGVQFPPEFRRCDSVSGTDDPLAALKPLYGAAVSR